jgi:hypothetical protein
MALVPGLCFRTLRSKLKLPKCEIFNRSDFHDFYTIKPFWVGDFVAKIYCELFTLIFGGARDQFLTRTLNAHINPCVLRVRIIS